jgi:hypothetical protein
VGGLTGFVFGIRLSLVANIGETSALSVLQVTVAACPPLVLLPAVELGVSRKSFMWSGHGPKRRRPTPWPGRPAWSADVDISRVCDMPQTCVTITMIETLSGVR